MASAPGAVAAVRTALADAISKGLSSKSSRGLRQPLHAAGADADRSLGGAQQNSGTPPPGPPSSSSDRTQNGLHANGVSSWGAPQDGEAGLMHAGNGGLQRQQEAELYLDFRPFMDQGPTTVRSAPPSCGALACPPTLKPYLPLKS